jgi:hypothetical protein
MAATSALLTMSPADGARPCAVLNENCHLNQVETHKMREHLLLCERA